MTGGYVTQEWWLIRHAPVKPSGLIYGHLDLAADFSDTGRLDVLADLLPGEGTVVTSDLTRCRDTVRYILDRKKDASFPLIERAALREQNFGQWEGKSYREIETEDESRYRAFFSDPVNCKPDGGENFQDLLERAQGELDVLLQSIEEQNLIIVTHAGVIRAMVGLALGLTPEKMLSLAIDPLSLTHLTSFRRDAETSWRVNFVNDLNRAKISQN